MIIVIIVALCFWSASVNERVSEPVSRMSRARATPEQCLATGRTTPHWIKSWPPMCAVPTSGVWMKLHSHPCLASASAKHLYFLFHYSACCLPLSFSASTEVHSFRFRLLLHMAVEDSGTLQSRMDFHSFLPYRSSLDRLHCTTILICSFLRQPINLPLRFPQ